MRNALIGGSLVAIAVGPARLLRRDPPARLRRPRARPHRLPRRHRRRAVGAPVTLGLAVFCIGGGLPSARSASGSTDREIATGTILAFATALGVLFSSLATPERQHGDQRAVRQPARHLAATSSSSFALFTVGRGCSRSARVARPLVFASVDPAGGRGQGRAGARAGRRVHRPAGARRSRWRCRSSARCCCSRSSSPRPRRRCAITARPAAVVALGTAIGAGVGVGRASCCRPCSTCRRASPS